MTAVNTKAINLLGKEVSFTLTRKLELTAQSSIHYVEKISGKVTHVVIGIDEKPEISIDYGCDYFFF